MTDILPQSRPAWQTEELEDEWVDQDPEEETDEDEDNNLTYGTRSISLTAPLATTIRTNKSDRENDSTYSTATSQIAGTFLVRQDVPIAPLLPKTPGRNKQGLIKDFFSPLPLERMFEPPSPPISAAPLPLSVPSQQSQGHSQGLEDKEGSLKVEMPNVASFDGRKASMDCQFTFAVPRESSLDPNSAGSGAFPQAQSTPGPPFAPNNAAPMTDPRLRLFQFQYDTFTRDHLSAMVDSIAPSGSSGTGTTASPTSFVHGLSRVSEVTGTNASTNISHLRSTKRVKLSPRSDYYGEGAGAGAVIARPKIFGKDYVGESRSLMQQIKQARDFSTISTVASGQQDSPHSGDKTNNSNDQDISKQKTTPEARHPSLLGVPENASNPPSAGGTTSSKSGSYSSSTYRQQAAALMAQIKSDMKGQKRIFSGDTDVSHITTHLDDKEKSTTRSSSPETIQIHLPSYPDDDKENHRGQPQRHHRTSSIKSNSSAKTKQKVSPRKLLRRLSAADEVDRELAEEVSGMTFEDRWQHPETQVPALAASAPLTGSASSNTATPLTTELQVPPSSLAPPSYPSSSIRSGTNEDLNRFVSSSTASGTTLTSGSAPSFVKHAGPVQIRTIAPQDVPVLPDRVGKMVLDKVMMKWVKNTVQATERPDDEREYTVGMEGDGESEDPFRDIESLDDTRGGDGQEAHEEVEQEQEPMMEADGMSRIEEQSEMDDEEEMELTSFSFDDPSAGVVHVMTGVETDEMEDPGNDETTDSEDDDDDDEGVTVTDLQDDGFDTEDDLNPGSESICEGQSSVQQPPFIPVPAISTTLSTPHRAAALPSSVTPVIRSALKSNSATPTSVLKDASRHKHRKPIHKMGHRRSVSFSDGKRDGPIRGLSRNASDEVGASGESGLADSSMAGTSAGFLPSARSKRIADMMGALEDSTSDNHESPSKASSSGRLDELRPLTTRRPSSVAAVAGSSKGSIPRRVFSRSQTHRLSPAKPSRSNSIINPNATFLTECSFGVAHDRLVQVITDVQPFEPHWEDLSTIDLSDKKIESVARLKEFLPRLDSLSLNSNQLSWLSGVPGTLRTLSVASNNLTGITSYSHLLNLENLDISRNDIDSLRQLACLRHLRELRADANKITSIDGLQRIDGLMKLSLQGNCIRSVDLAQYRWTRLEMLNLSQNRLDNISGLASLASLIALNIDNNSLGELELNGAMPRLRILRASGNRLHQLNVALVPNLRTLYADNNALAALIKVDRLTKLENLSLRNQSGRGLNLLTRDVRDVKRLYLSGNPLRANFLEEPCYNLVYLELAACRLTALPEELATLVPNLRVLNLNYNFLEDARPLGGLTRLKKLTIIGSRLKGTKPLIRLLQRMPDVEMLDFRMNPCTLGWYLPLLVKDVPGALQPSEGGDAGKRGEKAVNYAWQELDSKFRRDLPDEAYIGRLAYRGLVMRACPRIRMLDGVEVTEKERTKAHHLLQGILGKGKKSKGKELPCAS